MACKNRHFDNDEERAVYYEHRTSDLLFENEMLKQKIAALKFQIKTMQEVRE